MADGRIRIDVDVDNKEFVAGMDEVNQKIKETGQSSDEFAYGDLDVLEQQIQGATTETERLTATIERMKASLQFLSGEERLGELQAISEMEKELVKVQRTEQQLSKQKEYNAKQQAKLTDEVTKTDTSVRQLKKSSDNVGKSLSGGVKKIGRYALALFSVRSAYTGISRLSKDWLNSENAMAQQAKANLDYISSVLQSVIAPIISVILSMVATLMGYLSTLLNTFFGIEVSTKKTNKNISSGTKGIKKQTKEMKKQLAGFDEINKLSADTADNQNAGGGGGGGGIEPAVPTLDTSLFEKGIDKLKEIFQPFLDTINNIDFEPLKESLMNVGMAFGETLGIIGQSFVDMTNNTLAPFIALMMEDFLPPMFNALANLIEHINPLLQYLLQELVEPLFHWFMLEVVPRGVQLITSALEFLAPVVDVVRQSFEHLWENVWKPIFSFLADNFLWAFDRLIDLVGALTDDVIENEEEWVSILNAVMKFGTYALVIIGVIKTISKVWDILAGVVLFVTKTLGSLKTMFGIVKGVIVAVSGTIGGMIAIITALVLAIVGLVTNWRDAWQDMKAIGNNIKGIFKGIIDFVAGVFTGDWSRAWRGVVSVFRNIVGGIANIFKLPINAMISGLNTFIRGVNKVKIPSWVPGVGGRGINIGQIPRLARGGIVSNPMIAEIGEDGKEAVVPLENNTQGLQMLADLLDERMSGNSGGEVINLVVDGKTLATVVNKENKKSKFATNGGYAF